MSQKDKDQVLRHIEEAMDIAEVKINSKGETKMSEEEKKSWYESKTLWINAVGIGLLVAKYFGLIGEADIPAEYAVTGVVAFVANIILRIITSKKITSSK